MDVDVLGQRFRFISVYMPHGGYDDEDVEGVYSQLDELLRGAKNKYRVSILMVDWNAVVGTRETGDREDIVGAHGVRCRNARGEWIVVWATAHDLAIANTMIENCFDDQWTYDNGGNKRQIDYCLIDMGRMQWIQGRCIK